MDRFTRAAQALSDGTRIRILNLLLEQECCGCEVMQALGISQTRASRHLKVLSRAGFVDVKTDGLYSIYSLKKDSRRQRFYADLLDAVREVLKGNSQARRDIARLQKAPGCKPQ